MTPRDFSPEEILALTIIGEARGEVVEGQIAVGNVIRNRMLHNPKRYITFADVCLEPWQFSCWNTNDPNYTVLMELGAKMLNGQVVDYTQCIFIAEGIAHDHLLDNTGGALYYMTVDLFNTKRPTWAANAKSPRTIGRHIFFSI